MCYLIQKRWKKKLKKKSFRKQIAKTKYKMFVNAPHFNSTKESIKIFGAKMEENFWYWKIEWSFTWIFFIQFLYSLVSSLAAKNQIYHKLFAQKWRRKRFFFIYIRNGKQRRLMKWMYYNQRLYSARPLVDFGLAFRVKWK